MHAVERLCLMFKGVIRPDLRSEVCGRKCPAAVGTDLCCLWLYFKLPPAQTITSLPFCRPICSTVLPLCDNISEKKLSMNSGLLLLRMNRWKSMWRSQAFEMKVDLCQFHDLLEVLIHCYIVLVDEIVNLI